MTRLESADDEGIVPVERPMWARYGLLFGAALFARLAVALAFRLIGNGSLIYDDATYHHMAVDAARHSTGRWDAFTHSLYDATATLLVPLTGLYRLFGAHQIIGQAFLAVAGSATALLTAVLVARILPWRLSLLAGAVVAFLPSQVLFSAVTLKDGLVWMFLAALAVIVAALPSADGRRLVALVVALTGALFLLAHLRLHTFVVANIAALLAVWVVVGRSDVRKAAAVTIITALLPLYIGAGVFGVRAVPNQGHIETYRNSQATGNSPILRQTTTTTLAATATTSATAEHVPVTTPPASPDDGVASNLRHAPAGIVAVLLRPFPWSRTDNNRLLFARLENLVWYVLLALAAVGTVAVIRHRARAFAFPVLVCVGMTAVYTLAEGNLGTAFRHRGEIVWAVAAIGAVGVDELFRLRRWRQVTAAADATPVAEPGLTASPSPVATAAPRSLARSSRPS